jgi:TolB-like protein/AraC-like DNA-binding protein
MSEFFATDKIFISKLTNIILANLGDKNFGADELAHESGMSLFRLNRRLRSINGKTTSQFIREVRLQRALELLQNEAYTVSEVAYMSGFSSPSYFNTCFHEFFGYTPGEVKKGGSERIEEDILTQDILKREQKRSAWRTFILTSAGILFLGAMGYIVYTLFLKDLSSDPGIPVINIEKSIAILPFKNLSNNITDQYFYDGVMEEIFNNLSRVHDLRVISRPSVEQYKNTTKTITEIGKELDVNYIVDGSGQKYGNTFRLRVQLIEVSTDKYIWTKPYQHKMKRIKKLFSIQSRIAKNIASELKATITQKEKELIEKVPTVNMTAYNLYLKANGYQKDIENTRNDSSYQTAVDLYRAALKTDSTFAKAYTGLAFAYWNRYYYETYFEKNYLDSCLNLAKKALLYDDQLDEAYFIKGEYYRINGQSDTALYNYDKALEINPNYFAAYERKWYLLTWVLGDYVKGLDNCLKALNLIRGNERPSILKALGRTYLDVGFIEKAKYYYHEAFVLDSNKASYLRNLAWIEFCVENFEEALRLWKQLGKIDSTSTASQNYYFVTPGHNEEAYILAAGDVENLKKSGTLNLIRSHRTGYAFWQVGKKKEAEFYFNQQIEYSKESIKLNRDIDQRKSAYYDLSATYAFLGDKVKAYKYLDEYSKRKSFSLSFVIFARHDLLFESIRKEDRFQKILQTIESKYQAERDRVSKWLEGQEKL